MELLKNCLKTAWNRKLVGGLEAVRSGLEAVASGFEVVLKRFEAVFKRFGGFSVLRSINCAQGAHAQVGDMSTTGQGSYGELHEV